MNSSERTSGPTDLDGEAVPWDDLTYTEKRQFAQMLADGGLDIDPDTPEEAEVYYGAKHRAHADAHRKSMPEYEPAHDTHYGHIATDPVAELYGVGEFHPDSASPGTPVFEAKTENGSYLTFAFLPDEVEDAYLWVFHANSYVPGEFSFLMNRVFHHFGGDPPEARTVAFSNVVTEFLRGANLDDKLHGFDRETRVVENGPQAGDEYEILAGTWDPNRGESRE